MCDTTPISDGGARYQDRCSRRIADACHQFTGPCSAAWVKRMMPADELASAGGVPEGLRIRSAAVFSALLAGVTMLVRISPVESEIEDGGGDFRPAGGGIHRGERCFQRPGLPGRRCETTGILSGLWQAVSALNQRGFALPTGWCSRTRTAFRGRPSIRPARWWRRFARPERGSGTPPRAGHGAVVAARGEVMNAVR